MSDATESARIDAARAGDRDALEALLTEQEPRIWRFAMKMCGSEDQAADILQNTMLAIARSIGDFRGDASLSSWIFTIARRFCAKERKKATRETPDTEAVARAYSEAPDPEQAAADHELGQALNRAISQLESDSRQVLVLRDVEGLSAKEVSEVTGLSVGAVKSRLHRARVVVRDAMTTHLAPKPSADCPDILLAYSRMEEGELTPDVCAELEKHVEQCETCGAACQSLKASLSACRTSPKPVVPEKVRRNVRDALRQMLGG